MTGTRLENSEVEYVTDSVRRLLIVFCAGAIFAWFTGCGDGRPKLVRATGTVMLDGKPLAGAVVCFQPVSQSGEFQRPSSAITDAEGKFSPGTYGEKDGLPAGKYRVAIQKREPVGAGSGTAASQSSGPAKYQWITPRRLADPNTSGLEVEVTSSGLEPAVFDLESEGPPEVEIGSREVE